MAYSLPESRDQEMVVRAISDATTKQNAGIYPRSQEDRPQIAEPILHPLLIIDYVSLERMLKTAEKVRRVTIRAEDILTSKEADVLRLTDRGELPCPRCGEPLHGDKMIKDGTYVGIVLVCLDRCGFREY